jgi:ACT domain-containing protein
MRAGEAFCANRRFVLPKAGFTARNGFNVVSVKNLKQHRFAPIQNPSLRYNVKSNSQEGIATKEGFNMFGEHSRAVITVIGKDQVGIIAGITTVLATRGVNILDINQTILDGFFTMITVVDLEGCSISLPELKRELEIKGQELGMDVRTQHEDVFNYMHRI